MPRRVTSRRVWADVAYLIVFAVIIGFVVQLLGIILLPIVAAFLASYVLTPIVEYLERRGLSRLVAVTCLYGILIGAMASIAVYVIPALADEMRTLHVDLPRYTSAIHQSLQTSRETLEQYFPILERVNLAERVGQAVDSYAWAVADRWSLDAVLVISTLLLTPLIAWYLLLEAPAIKKSLVSRVPNRYFETTLNVIYRVDQHLSRYLLGQLVNVVSVSALSAVCYSVIGVQFGIAIGLLSGITNVIPYVGPLVGASIALLVSLMDGSPGNKLMAVVIVATMIYLFDHVVIKMVVFAKTTDLHPLTTLTILIVAGGMWGVWGLLFGIPAFCVTRIIVQELGGVLQRRSMDNL